MYLGDDAYEKQVHGATIKVRDPWRVGIFALVTLGIYGIVWFYQVNRELAEYAKARAVPKVGGSPVLAVLGVTVGALLVVPFIATWVWTLIRIRRAQEVEGVPALTFGTTVAAAAVWLVPVAGTVVWHEHVQFHLNAIWRHTPGTAMAALAQPTPVPAPA